LQGEAKLDAQEAEAHVPNLPEREFFGAHVGFVGVGLVNKNGVAPGVKRHALSDVFDHYG
jgi:hypothetical protein